MVISQNPRIPTFSFFPETVVLKNHVKLGTSKIKRYLALCPTRHTFPGKGLQSSLDISISNELIDLWERTLSFIKQKENKAWAWGIKVTMPTLTLHFDTILAAFCLDEHSYLSIAESRDFWKKNNIIAEACLRSGASWVGTQWGGTQFNIFPTNAYIQIIWRHQAHAQLI